MNGICTSVDIFGHSSTGKSFIALSTSHSNSYSSSSSNNSNNSISSSISSKSKLSIYEIPSNENSNFLERNINEKYEDKIFTNITSHIASNQLTACTEFGDVIIHDINEQEIQRFNADYCGLQTIKYSNSGLLITLGLSSGGQLSLWDTRTSQLPSLSCCLRPPSLSSNSPSSSFTTSSPSYLTSVLTSHRNDYDMLCGTSTGSIIQWDTRYEGLIFSPHQIHHTNSSGTFYSSRTHYYLLFLTSTSIINLILFLFFSP